MKKPILASGLALGLCCGAAAAEPSILADAQLDRITAGADAAVATVALAGLNDAAIGVATAGTASGDSALVASSVDVSVVQQNRVVTKGEVSGTTLAAGTTSADTGAMILMSDGAHGGGQVKTKENKDGTVSVTTFHAKAVWVNPPGQAGK